MKYTRQEVVRILRKAGFHEAADEAMRDLPGDWVASWIQVVAERALFYASEGALP